MHYQMEYFSMSKVAPEIFFIIARDPEMAKSWEDAIVAAGFK